ncbi:hypothetical protein DRH27_02715 [Candidatus Falkowbacteria bacterium]|nr:MAG: hypothetical protein DRH27_02715 [Candidatus Falkowbacteria bacterium]
MINNKKEILAEKNELKSTAMKSLIINFLYNYFNVIVIFIIAIFLIAGFLYIIKPKYKSIKNNIAAVNEAQEMERNEMEKYYNKLIIYKRNYDSIDEAGKDKINTMLPQGGETEGVIAEMENLVVNRGMLLSNLSVKSDEASSKKISKNTQPNLVNKKPGNIGTINLEANIEGVDYRGMKMLLDTFENNLRILDINKINFLPASETTLLEMSTYYLISN